MSRHLMSCLSLSCRAMAAVLAAALLLAADCASASMSSTSRSGGGLSSSSTNSRSRNSSRNSNSGDDFGDSGGNDSGTSRDSGSRRGSSSRRSSSRSSRSSSHGSSRSFGGGSRSSKPAAPPPFIFGTKFERDGVRPHGTVLSSTAFTDLPGKTEVVSVNGTDFYRRNGAWYQRIEQDGWTCYAEIYPPAGLRVATVPDGAIALSGNGRTYYATENAVYALEPGLGYVVVEPPVGTTFTQLPASATSGIPVVVNGTAYYRYLGLFYRDDTSAGERRYVVSKSPFLEEPAAATAPTMATVAAPTSVDRPAYEASPVRLDPPAPGSPRAIFLESDGSR